MEPIPTTERKHGPLYLYFFRAFTSFIFSINQTNSYLIVIILVHV
jgi:hypothetical protein